MKLPPRFILVSSIIANVKPLIVDTLASGKGTRHSTRDVIGAGPRSVAGVLESMSLEPDIIPVEAYLAGYCSTQYDLILISGMTSDIQAIRKVSRKWRKERKRPVIIGGPAASEPRRILRKTGGDIAVTGEGEYTLVELFDNGLIEGRIPSDLSDIPGISYKKAGKIQVNPLRPVQPKTIYSQYPVSTKTITGYPLYKSARVYVETVRGCSNYHRARIGTIGEKCINCEQCTKGELVERYSCPVGIPPGCGYCSVPSLYGPPKSKPVDLLVNEVSNLLDHGVHRIVLSAPGFLDYQREVLVEPEPLTDPRNPEPNYEAIENLLVQLSNLEKVKNSEASLMIENIKAVLVTERSASILGHYLSGTPVSVGFETGSEKHSRLLGRPDTPSETLVALRRLKKAGMEPYVYFIHGLPGQTENTVNETVDMIKNSVKAGAERVILYRFQSLPLSTFTDYPSGPPVTQNPLSKRISNAAREANLDSKKDLVGRTIKVVVAEEYGRDSRYYVAYPLYHGPVVLLEGSKFESGEVVSVKITSIASERMVYGKKH
jgi:radical SAM superfamily enzyme YgiQ (UPF0313 family)